jgi:Uma2 family endonuclease
MVADARHCGFGQPGQGVRWFLRVIFGGMRFAPERPHARRQQDQRMDERDDMPTASRGRRLTYEDFQRFADDGKRHEIIDGVHYVTPSPNVPHQRLVSRLFFAIELWLRANPARGEVFLSPLDVVLSKWDVVEPDLLFVAVDQSDVVTEKNLQGPPALVVEVLSRGTRRRDLGIKRALFERTGVREYWLVDPDRDAITVLRRTAQAGFNAPIALSREGGDLLTTPLFPGFSLPLTDLFAR